MKMMKLLLGLLNETLRLNFKAKTQPVSLYDPVMQLNTSFQALTKAGLAKDYFSLKQQPLLEVGSQQFSLQNAWCLAELSRLVYRQESDELGDDFDGLTRQTVLQQAGMREIAALKNDQVSSFAMLVAAQTIDQKPCTVLAFRGSNEFEDWRNNFMLYQTKAFDGGMVHAGFMRALRAIWKDLRILLREQQGPLYITGHSLGAALATLATAQLLRKGHAVEACYVFGSPRTGDQRFTRSFNNMPFFRVENASDFVTSVPLDIAQVKYSAAGECYYFDHDGELHYKTTQQLITQDRKLNGWRVPDLKSFTDWAYRLKSMSDKLPLMLSGHAPANYVARLQNSLDRT